MHWNCHFQNKVELFFISLDQCGAFWTLIHSCVIYFIHLFHMQFHSECTRSHAARSVRFIRANLHSIYSVRISIIHCRESVERVVFGTMKTQLFNKLFKVGSVFFICPALILTWSSTLVVCFLRGQNGISLTLYGWTLSGMAFFVVSLFHVQFGDDKNIPAKAAAKNRITNWKKTRSIDCLFGIVWQHWQHLSSSSRHRSNRISFICRNGGDNKIQ